MRLHRFFVAVFALICVPLVALERAVYRGLRYFEPARESIRFALPRLVEVLVGPTLRHAGPGSPECPERHWHQRSAARAI